MPKGSESPSHLKSYTSNEEEQETIHKQIAKSGAIRLKRLREEKLII